jgi:RNA polymerase sigma-70 factor (family 1)
LSFLLPYDARLLLKEIAKGNEKAFKTLYDGCFDHITAYIFKLCKSPSATEEIMQEIFLKLWVNRAALADVDTPEAYIFTIARNKTIDYLRRLAKESRLINTLSAQLQHPDNNIDDKLNREELQRLIEEALSQLSPQKNQVFRLSKQEGLTHDEIAERMQVSKSTVKNHLSETLKHIREHISKQPNHETLFVLLVTFIERVVNSR